MLAGTHFLLLIALMGIATAQQECMINFNGTAGNHFMFLANGGKEETLTLEGDPECHLRYGTKFLFSDHKIYVNTFKVLLVRRVLLWKRNSL